MATLKEDIKIQSDWLVKAFAADKLQLDFTIHSFIEIDKFFNKHVKNGKPVKGGRLSKNLGSIVFSTGSYIGQTLIKNIPEAVWETDDNDPQGEITASVKLPNDTVIWPMQRVMKRFQNGSEDSIYVYGHSMTKDYINEPFDQTFWDAISDSDLKDSKPWWKFW